MASKKVDVEVIHGVVDGNKPGKKIKVTDKSASQLVNKGLVKRLPVKKAAKKESAPKEQPKTEDKTTDETQSTEGNNESK